MQGPIPKANIKVPIPIVPPKYQPTEATEISIKDLTAAIGRLVFFCHFVEIKHRLRNLSSN